MFPVLQVSKPTNCISTEKLKYVTQLIQLAFLVVAIGIKVPGKVHVVFLFTFKPDVTNKQSCIIFFHGKVTVSTSINSSV